MKPISKEEFDNICKDILDENSFREENNLDLISIDEKIYEAISIDNYLTEFSAQGIVFALRQGKQYYSNF